MSSCCGPSRGSEPSGPAGFAAHAGIAAHAGPAGFAGVAGPAGIAGPAAPAAPAGIAGPAGPATHGTLIRADADLTGMVRIPAGEFTMGDDSPHAFPGDGEGPVRRVYVSEFLIDTMAVTNHQFGAFVDATRYRTEAERFGWSFVFDALIDRRDRSAVVDGTVPGAPWWTAVRGADWAHPFGPHSDTARMPDHPAVHVSWNDAVSYADWTGKRLPTEAEWEKACRGGLEQATFPWGNDLEPGGRHRMNVWQGTFPHHNSGDDGHLATAPADTFLPNGFGLYNTTGNVWEWTADHFSAHWHSRDGDRTRRDPQGPPAGPTKVLRGGSYLCHASYCNRYRTAGRTQNTPDTSTGHMGFRCAASPR